MIASVISMAQMACWSILFSFMVMSSPPVTDFVSFCAGAWPHALFDSSAADFVLSATVLFALARRSMLRRANDHTHQSRRSRHVLIPPLRISFRPLRYFLPRHGACCAVPYSEKQYRSGPADAGSAAVFCSGIMRL